MIKKRLSFSRQSNVFYMANVGVLVCWCVGVLVLP